MKVDLHCHSNISDGLLTPEAVVARAHERGVDLLALTDHDDVAGLATARAKAAALGMGFINGVEISAGWKDESIHLVGLGINPEHPDLAAGLHGVREGRLARAKRMDEALARVGIPGALEGALRFASQATMVGRLHFARYLVEQRIAPDVKSVFDHYLAQGKPGYVSHEWVSLETAIGWIKASGGVAVLAHPGRYRVSRKDLKRLLTHFQDAGGEGIEVNSGAHTPEQMKDFANIARQYGFKASIASDFHAPGESYRDLGSLPALPEDLIPVWRDLH